MLTFFKYSPYTSAILSKGIGILLIFLSFAAVCQERNQETGSKNLHFTKVFFDETGRNKLRITIINPCVPDTPPWDANYCHLEVTLASGKNNSRISYTHPDPQMSLIYLNSAKLTIERINGSNALLIPFYYCGNSEDYNKKVSYIIFYQSKAYLYHLDFRCDDKGNCKPITKLASTLKKLPAPLKTYLINHLSHQYSQIKSFP